MEMDHDIAVEYLTVNARLNGFEATTVDMHDTQHRKAVKPYFRVYNVAMSDTDDGLKRYVRDSDNVGGARIRVDAATRHESHVVSTLTLDSLLAASETERVTFCKIDTESHEASVLRGAQKSLKAGRILELVCAPQPNLHCQSGGHYNVIHLTLCCET